MRPTALVCSQSSIIRILRSDRLLTEVFIKPARRDSDILPGDASFVLRRYMWAQWDASEDYTASTLPLIVGSIGGLFAAFTGVLAAIFGTSVGFIFFGEEISICSLIFHL